MTTTMLDARTAMRADFGAFLPQLAAALKATVTADDTRETSADLTLADGVSLHVYLETYGAGAGKFLRVSLTTLHYKDASGNHQHTTAGDVTRYGELQGAVTEIGASMARGAVTVARAIERRLLPDARRVWAGMVARRDSTLAYEAKTQSTLARIVEAAGREGRDRNGTVYLEHGTCRVSGDSVTFDRLSVSVEKALRLIAIINEPVQS